MGIGFSKQTKVDDFSLLDHEKGLFDQLLIKDQKLVGSFWHSICHTSKFYDSVCIETNRYHYEYVYNYCTYLRENARSNAAAFVDQFMDFAQTEMNTRLELNNNAYDGTRPVLKENEIQPLHSVINCLFCIQLYLNILYVNGSIEYSGFSSPVSCQAFFELLLQMISMDPLCWQVEAFSKAKYEEIQFQAVSCALLMAMHQMRKSDGDLKKMEIEISLVGQRQEHLFQILFMRYAHNPPLAFNAGFNTFKRNTSSSLSAFTTIASM